MQSNVRPVFQEVSGRVRQTNRPTVLLIREDAPESVRNRFAIVSFRDAVCACAIVFSQARRLTWGRATGIPYSDAFDVYPWVPDRADSGLVYAVTPSMGGVHDVKLLRGQPTPPSGQASLSVSDIIDDPLLASILDRWEQRFVGGKDTVENRGLFRALDMARAASRMPGGSDATFYDGGRAIALWVSAFEILAHVDGYANARRVLELLGRVPWINKKLKTADRSCKVSPRSREMIETNVAGELYVKLNEVRNDFLHGNPVTGETANLPKCKKPVLIFAAPLFRLALTAYLKLETQDAAGEPNSWGKFIAG